MDVISISIELFVAICMIVIISTLFTFMIIRDIRFREIESKSAIELVRSRVIGKREVQSKRTDADSSGITYFSVFEVRGELLEMQVLSDEQFRELRIGQKGLLQYQRKNQTLLYIHFDSD
jgi:hypothetical protein